MKALVWIVGIVVLALTVVTIVIGGRTFEGIVVDKPYEAGLAWDAERENRLALGWTVTLSPTDCRVGDNELRVEARDREGRPLAADEVGVSVSRPSTRAYDRSYEARAEVPGSYLARVALPLRGSWNVTIMVHVKEDRCAFVQSVEALGEAP